MKKLQVRIERRYVVSVMGEDLGSFKECGEMAGLRHLKDDKGRQIILDFPSDSGIHSVIDEVLGNESFDAGLIKASPTVLEELRQIVSHNTKESDDGRHDEQSTASQPESGSNPGDSGDTENMDAGDGNGISNSIDGGSRSDGDIRDICGKDAKAGSYTGPRVVCKGGNPAKGTGTVQG